MRRQFGILTFAGVMGLGAVAASSATGTTIDDARQVETTAPVAVQRVTMPATGIRDEAAMVLVGTALIGLAAALRRAA
jgi:hypothetical protein